MRVPVWVENWQLQCCGEPFAVDSVVSWTLTTHSDDLLRALGSLAPTWSATLPVLASATGSAVSGLVVGAGDLRVFVDTDGDSRLVEPSGVPVRLLIEDHHVGVPEEFAPTSGRVTGIELVRFAYERGSDDEAWRPQPDGATLTQVAQAQKWPDDEVDGRSFAGYLVQLDVAVPDDAPAVGPAPAIG